MFCNVLSVYLFVSDIFSLEHAQGNIIFVSKADKHRCIEIMSVIDDTFDN